jgi:DNA-binding IclR family transcriptional regulator
VYQLGFQFLTVAGVLKNREPEYALVEDVVQQLAAETGERAQFVVEEQGERVFLDTETGENAVKAEAQLGRRGPLHCSAAGKAILADLPEDYVQNIIEHRGLPAVTEKSITGPDELFAELEEIREQGVAFNREESTEALHAVGTSILKPDGTVLGGVSVSGPANRLSGERFDSEIPGLIRGLTQQFELNIKYSE